MNGLDILCEEYGYDEAIEMVIEFENDSIIPAICSKCGTMYEYEPDCNNGYCHHCKTNNVNSLFVLVGVV